MTKHGAANSAHSQSQASAGTLGHADSPAQKQQPEESTSPSQADTADDDADSFDKIPTVSNGTNPLIAAPPEEPTPGIGTYRMVRPTTDIVTPPPPTKPQKPNRLVLGVGRK